MALTVKVVLDDEATAALIKMGKLAEQNTSAFAKWGDVMKGVLGAEAVKKAGEKLLEFLGSCAIQALEAEKANKLLDATLKATGQYTGEASASLKEYAAAMMKSSVFDKEKIQNSERLLMSLAGLNEQGIKAMMPSIMDLAAADGDLEGATHKVALAIEGQGKGLKQYGIILSKGADEGTRFKEIQDQINQRFGGQSQAIMETHGGKIENLKNKWSDLKEGVGDAALRLADTLGILDKINAAIDHFNAKPAEENLNVIAAKSIERGRSEASRVGIPVSSMLTVPGIPAMPVFSGQPPELDFLGMPMIPENKAALNMAALASGASGGSTGPFNANFTKTGAAGKTAGADAAKELQAALEQTDKEFQEKMDRWVNFENKKIAKQKDFDEKKRQMNLEFEDAINEAVDASEKKRTEAEAKAARDRLMITEQEWQEKFRLAGAAANLGMAIEQASEKGSAAAKMGARISIIADTAAAIMGTWKGWASFGPVGWAAAITETAAIGIMGATQLAKVQSLRMGGIVPGPAYRESSDTVPAWLTPRERVLSHDDIRAMGGNSAIDRAINGSRGGGGGIIVNVAGSIVAPDRWVQDTLVPTLERYQGRSY